VASPTLVALNRLQQVLKHDGPRPAARGDVHLAAELAQARRELERVTGELSLALEETSRLRAELSRAEAERALRAEIAKLEADAKRTLVDEIRGVLLQQQECHSKALADLTARLR
jgi:hypothetical protein